MYPVIIFMGTQKTVINSKFYQISKGFYKKTFFTYCWNVNFHSKLSDNFF